MSKLGNKVLEMTELAIAVDKAAFVEEYGPLNADFYDQVYGINREMACEPPPAIIDSNGIPF